MELAPALPPHVLAAVGRALQKDPSARPPDVGEFILELTGRPLSSFNTGQPVGLEATQMTPRAMSAGEMEATHTPRPGAASTPAWSASSAHAFDAAARSSALTSPPPAQPPPRPAWPLVLGGGIALMAGAIALGQWLAVRQPETQRSAALAPLDRTQQIPTPPPPPELAVAPIPPDVPSPPAPPAVEPPPARPPRMAAQEKAQSTRRRLLKKTTPEPAAAEPPQGPQVAEARPPPAPADGIRPDTRKLLDQAEEALSKNRPLDATRLVDQSFFLQKTSLGYAIQVRAACQRRDVGAARAAIRNVVDPVAAAHGGPGLPPPGRVALLGRVQPCATRPGSPTSPPAPWWQPSSPPHSPRHTTSTTRRRCSGCRPRSPVRCWRTSSPPPGKRCSAGTKKLDEEGLLEKVARSLADRPLRPGRLIPVTADLSAFLLLADLAAGTASDAAGRVMETDAGKTRARAGLQAAGQHLARELTR